MRCFGVLLVFDAFQIGISAIWSRTCQAASSCNMTLHTFAERGFYRTLSLVIGSSGAVVARAERVHFPSGYVLAC